MRVYLTKEGEIQTTPVTKLLSMGQKSPRLKEDPCPQTMIARPYNPLPSPVGRQRSMARHRTTGT